MIRATDFRSAGDVTGTSRRALLVTGPYGSETSTFARVFNLVGAALPEHLRPPTGDGNGAPRFWEPARVVELNADALRAAGAVATEAASVPPEWFDTGAAEALSRQAARILEEEFGKSRLLVVEDTRLARLVPLWETALARAGMNHAFVIALRDPLAVAQGLEKGKALPAAASLLVWLQDLVSLELASRGRARRFVSYERLLRDWPAQLAEIASALGIDWPRSPDLARAEIDEFLSGAQPLEGVAATELDADPELAEWARRCYEAALELQGDAAQATFFDEVRAGLAADGHPAPTPPTPSPVAQEPEPPAPPVAPDVPRQVEELLTDLADANRRLDKEAADIARLEAAAATLETEARALRAELAQTQSDLAERADRASRAEERVEVLDAEVAALKTQLEDAKGLASSEADQVARLEAILSEREAEAREQREHVEQLGSDLQERTERAARAEERTQSLEEQIEKLSAELTEARSAATGRAEHVARLEGALESRKAEQREQRERNERLQGEVRDRGEKAVRAEARAEAIERELERLTAELAERDRRLAEADEHVREAREETARLASELQAAQAERGADADAVARAEAEQRRLADRATELEEQVAQAEQTAASSEEQVAALSSRLDAAQRELQQSQGQLVSVRMLAERRRAEAESLRQQFDEAQAERSGHESALAAAQEAARASTARSEALLHELEELREQLAQRDSSLKAVSDEAASLRQQAKTLSEELRSARDGFAKREEELKQKARQETQGLSKELETARGVFAKREQELTEKARTLTAGLDEARGDADRLRSEVATLREDLGKARGRAKNVTEALESAQAESTRYQAAARQAQERVSSMERRLQTVNDRLERATGSAAEAKNEAAALRGDLDDARYQLGVVERELGDARGFEQRSAELEVELERARAVIAMRRTVHGELYRSMSQFFSWLVRRPSRERLRHVRTYLELRRSGLFDEGFYLSRYLDVTQLGLNPLMHYIEHGVHERREPNADFDTQRYLAQHPDLLERGVNPLLDYSRRVKRGELAAPPPRPALPPVPAIQVMSEPHPDELAAQAGQALVQQTLEIVPGARGVDYSDFTVLLARQRSGTNALRSVLRSHADIYCYSEVFSFIEKDSHEPIPGMPDGVKVSRHDINFHTFLQRHGLADHLASWSTGHEIAFLDYLEYLRCFTPKPYLLLDVKYNSVHFLTEPWAYNITSPYFFDLLLKHNLKVLNVTRRNYLRYVISNAKARQTGRWHSSRRRGGFSDLAIELDVEFMMSELERCYDEDVAVAKRFVDYHNYRSFEYADIFGPAGATPEFLATLADWLGVPPEFHSAPAFKKQSSLTLEQTVQNYDEVVAALTGTKFEYCLEDEPIYRTPPDAPDAAPQSRPS